MDVAIAIAISSAIVVLLVIIEIPVRSGAEMRNCFHSAFCTYFLLMLLCNGLATLLSYPAAVAAGLPGPLWLWAPVIGVFGFEAVIQRVNVTVYGENFLTIDRWISMARDHAVAKSNTTQAIAEQNSRQAIANVLLTIDPAVLDTHISHHLGADTLTQLNANAASTSVNAQLLKALTFADASPDAAKAVAHASE